VRPLGGGRRMLLRVLGARPARAAGAQLPTHH
jgi:hypothetical protein